MKALLATLMLDLMMMTVMETFHTEIPYVFTGCKETREKVYSLCLVEHFYLLECKNDQTTASSPHSWSATPLWILIAHR